MAVEAPSTFEDWYVGYEVDPRSGCLNPRSIGDFGTSLRRRFERYKQEMDSRVCDFWKLELLADGQVISTKPDLPNVSSGETAGLVRRIARNLVQNVPNVEVISHVDDDSVGGIFVRHILKTKVIGSDLYSNDMQQNLFASTKGALTTGFDCVVPVLLQDGGHGWYMKYDTIHYRDVFPEPGCKDVRQATDVFVRRYLTKGEVSELIKNRTAGWDLSALQTLLQSGSYRRQEQSSDAQSKKRGLVPHGYEIVTWYSSTGDDFLTFAVGSGNLLRIEKNKHPRKLHPVHFLVLEKDEQQPLGRSQVEFLVGRQEFQDLMLNGAMKLWYRNINPSIIGYGTINSVPNLSPGKYTAISNPNAKIEPFEVNTGTLMQYGQISEQNLGSMVSLIGAADQQMATQAGNGMSATPQGVEAQQAMVDITTNNYQKAIEAFVSHYCSYALTIYFQEMKGMKAATVSADTRKQLLEAGLKPEDFNEDGVLELDFSNLAEHEYFVRCVPGSLVEMEDEKQLRVLNQLFVPLSQAMPALAASGDQAMLRQATASMAYIIQKQIELSGSASAVEIKKLWTGDSDLADAQDSRIAELEDRLNSLDENNDSELSLLTQSIQQMQAQMQALSQINQTLMEKLGVQTQGSAEQLNSSAGGTSEQPPVDSTVLPASA